MKRLLAAAFASFAMTTTAFASDARTSATAGSNSNTGSGGAGATAAYNGDVGFARTDTQSGNVNFARGVAVGVDKDGITLSVSNALATRNGNAVAANFNMAINREGEVSHSGALTVARGPIEREATAGGSAASGGRFSAPVTTATATGRTDPFGTVTAQTHSKTDTVRPLRRGDVRRVTHDDPRHTTQRSFERGGHERDRGPVMIRRR